MIWRSAGFTWNEVPSRFNAAKRADEAAGGDGLDTTLVFAAWASLDKILAGLPDAARLALNALLGTAKLDPGLVVALHWGGEADDFAAALYAWDASRAVIYGEREEDHLLGSASLELRTADWIGEDLQHKIGWALGFWPSRTRY